MSLRFYRGREDELAVMQEQHARERAQAANRQPRGLMLNSAGEAIIEQHAEPSEENPLTILDLLEQSEAT